MTPRPQLVVITGLSGSGKSSIAKCFEDLGYYCVDNLPLDLLDQFLERPFELTRAKRGVAVVTDVRAPGFAGRALRRWLSPVVPLSGLLQGSYTQVCG